MLIQDWEFILILVFTFISTTNLLVQFYTFDDPASGTYGNDNFTYMFDFIFNASTLDPSREIIYHGETAYWVSYDSSVRNIYVNIISKVPLFLPLYGYGRLYDLRKIAKEEIATGIKIQGYMNFDSGWEW